MESVDLVGPLGPIGGLSQDKLSLSRPGSGMVTPTEGYHTESPKYWPSA